MSKVLQTANHFLALILDIVLPRSNTLKNLEKMTASDFVHVVRASQHNLPAITSLFDYKDPLVKEATWEIKFRGNQAITELAGRLLYEHLLAELGEQKLFSGDEKIILVPVPLAQRRLRERGFNQAERIARVMENIDAKKHIKVIAAVTRIKETPSQTKSRSRTERLKNLDGAFSVADSTVVIGKNVIVIDDVATTGTTIGETRKVLLEAGAKSVEGLTFAH